MKNQFLSTVEKALATNLEGYQKARKAFAHEYAMTRNVKWKDATASAVSASIVALSIYEVNRDELVRWSKRCERAYLENFHNGILEDSPTVAVIKCLD